MRARSLCTLCACVGQAAAFQAAGSRVVGRHSSSSDAVPRTQRTSARMAIDPSSLYDTVHALTASIDHTTWLWQATHGLADNTVAASASDVAANVAANVQATASSTAAAVVKDDGWFAHFVTFFADTIKSINGLYNKAGIENAFGLSIVTFTVGVKTLLLPLNFIQLQSSEKMQQIIPVQKKIAEMYPNDKAMQSTIITRLYQQTEVNPLAGCAPSLAQIPIFIGLYRSLTQLATENAVNEPFLWIPNLEGPVFDKGRGVQWLTENWDGFTPSLGWQDTIAYCSIPLFLVLSQSLSMKLLAPPVDPKDQKAKQTQAVLKYLPLMIGWFSLQVPAALGVYWMTNNIITTSATQGIKAYLKANPPVLDIPEDILAGGAPTFRAQTLEQATVEARINARPPTARTRGAPVNGSAVRDAELVA